MQSRNSVSIDFSSLVQSPDSTPVSSSQSPVNSVSYEEEWGRVQSKTIQLQSLAITKFSADLKRDLHIRQHEETECSTVNSCFLLNGIIASSFKGMTCNMNLRAGLQNFIYKPVVEDDHYIEAKNEPLTLLHVTIERDYFVGLLEHEKWCEELKEKINNKQLVSGGDRELAITPVMHRVIHEITHCPLTGPLGDLLLEAKILELTAYQLHQYNACSRPDQTRHSRTDREVFYALKEHLARTFDKEHSLRSLSREFGLNEFKLKKGFKAFFGFTVFGYIHSLRMQHAKTMMEDAGLSVAQAAAKTGYKNPNHFSAAFKKQFGLSPSSIRRAPCYLVA